MKGIVFTEFLEMVEDKFGFETADKIITDANLESEGVYTSVGTYHHKEMVELVSNLSHESGLPMSQLLEAFGIHLFSHFSAGYGRFFENVPDAFTFLSSIENYIHIEVKKLYPDAELPTFEINRANANTLIMVYKSERGFGDFALGLIKGCLKHFGEDISISRENLNGTKEVRFVLTQNS